jgi:hypothetical protein
LTIIPTPLGLSSPPAPGDKISAYFWRAALCFQPLVFRLQFLQPTSTHPSPKQSCERLARLAGAEEEEEEEEEEALSPDLASSTALSLGGSSKTEGGNLWSKACFCARRRCTSKSSSSWPPPWSPAGVLSGSKGQALCVEKESHHTKTHAHKTQLNPNQIQRKQRTTCVFARIHVHSTHTLSAHMLHTLGAH